jgi:hypothetical protein
MKKLGLALFSFLILFFILGCNDSSSSDLFQAPVYQSMFISSTNSRENLTFNNPIMKASLGFDLDSRMSINDVIEEDLEI